MDTSAGSASPSWPTPSRQPIAVDSTDVDRKQAQIHAERFERYHQLEPAVARLTNRFTATS